MQEQFDGGSVTAGQAPRSSGAAAGDGCPAAGHARHLVGVPRPVRAGHQPAGLPIRRGRQSDRAALRIYGALAGPPAALLRATAHGSVPAR